MRRHDAYGCLPMIVLALALGLLLLTAAQAFAHSWYSEKNDPVYRWGCCGGSDCATWKLRPGSISAEPTGYRIRLTLAEARAINPASVSGIDALVVWPRVQVSEDGNWHLCLMPYSRTLEAGGVFCLFAPPST